MKNAAIIVAFLLTGLSFAQFVRLRHTTPKALDSRFIQKANLALRRTAYFLLTEAGDSTSRIAPVQQSGATFQVRLEHPFNYDRLPALLQESLTQHGIQASYAVAVVDCAQGQLQLGYNVRDLTGQTGVPCVGRQQERGCYTLQVTFEEPDGPLPSTALLWIFGAGLLLTGLGYVGWQRATPARPRPVTAAPDPVKTDNRMRLGESWFNLANQSVSVAGVLHPLTYREAKLLHFFISHPNQVVERDLILKSVWEDEGVIVGRSVDVFVSRLRKLLHGDATVKITAVHGVGYRLEVQQEVGHTV